MSEKILMKGNEAIAEAAVRAGVKGYFGYPITPQNEVTAYMSKRMVELGRAFVQAESEVAAINMVYGAASTGELAMTTSSSPGIALMQEGISYMCGAEVPAVIVNISRGGPGLGNIGPSQGDYNQSTRGGGNGDYFLIVYTPSTLQEAVDITYKAFDVANRYRNPVLILGDGALGQMAETVVLPPFKELESKDKGWELNGCKGREPRSVKSLRLAEGMLKLHNFHLKEKFEQVKRNEVEYELIGDDYDILIVAFGTAARVSKSAIKEAAKHGVKVGMFRPILIWPYPYAQLTEAAKKAKKVLVVEMNNGQMLFDVMLAVKDDNKIEFLGKPGGEVVDPDEILEKILSIKG
ncbi:3-methyl-2-oxobutanoate dehydrogenase subunit VorB [Calditerrivibrio nitroreducens]|uniref:Pyruvate flavodoxin/ferredoxin oxidoreductase domain protein n=1 Tax=Calditerrivibrio nitroreducens (strain DSM 19672 / NBRC 101217 / Yu37-1) TaxID=768670 RepID=E4TJN4_CALNY|nr:3-methyl-2-oxobutanoate dehydrogenase subunit VorB [Calditerrivibrio nitroreducens]ADR18196.1 pyruvate flavodoxin/ferredoxin oxidoreductase domain protein [Calditerrivibrio nitroreducens DSM 19672]